MSEEQMTKKERIAQKKQEKAAAHAREDKKEQMKKVVFAVVIVGIVFGLIALAIASKPDPSKVEDNSPDPSKGEETAAVVIKEYSDFQCPACAAAYPVVKDLLEEYGDKVQFFYNDYPLPQHEYATDAAIGAQCAYDQQKFFKYHDTLFDNQDTWASSKTRSDAQEYFRTYAEDLKLDMDAFESCVTSQEIADRVNEDIAEGRALQVNSTPTFFVNGEKVTETPFSQGIRNAIDAALAQSEQ